MKSRLTAIIVFGAALALLGSQANAQTLFADNFDRADSRDIQQSLTGITDNTGSSLAAGSVYSQPWLDPNNQAPTFGVQDGNAANGGGAQVIGNSLQLAVGAGTANAYVTHNFINGSILAAGGFRVALDVVGYAGTGVNGGQGGGFAIGMSAAEAASAGDAFGDNHPSMTRAFHDVAGGTAVGTIGADIATVGLQPVVSDFWVAIRSNNQLVWGGSSGLIQGVTGLAAKTGTISANFSLGDFNAGSTVNYEIFLNGLSQGTGSFLWSGNNENYIGIDGRDGTAVTLDNFAVTIIPEPAAGTLGLIGLGITALVIRRRKS